MGKHFPTMSVIGVACLVERDALVEIEATAVSTRLTPWPSRQLRQLCPRQPAAARSMAGPAARGPRLPGASELRRDFAGSTTLRIGNGARPCIRSSLTEIMELRRATNAREPHCQCADASAWHGPRQSRAAARAQHADDGCRVFGGDQGRRYRGRDHAAVARPGAWRQSSTRPASHLPCAISD